MSIVIYASWRGCEPIWEQGQHTGQLICKSVAYLWMCTCKCLCVYVWMFVSINQCMCRGQCWKQAHNHCSSFIHYIYWISLQLMVLEIVNQSFSFAVFVCECGVMSTECWLILPTHCSDLLPAAGSHPTFWPLFLFLRMSQKASRKSTFPAEWLLVNGVPTVYSIFYTGL